MSKTVFGKPAVAVGGLAALALLTVFVFSGASWADDIPEGAAVAIDVPPVQEPVAARDEVAFSVQVEPMYMMVFGYEPHVLDMTQGFYEEDGFSYTQAVNNELDGDFAFRGDISLMKNQWGLGVTGFEFETEGSVMWSAGPDDVVWDPDPDDLWSIEYESALFFSRLWGGIEGWATDERYWMIRDSTPFHPEAVLDEMAFLAHTQLDVWTVDFYGIRTLAEKPESNVNLLFGAKIGSLDIDTATTHGIIVDQGPGDADDREGIEGLVEVTGATLLSQAQSDVLVGPYLALSGEARWGRFRVEGLLAQSVLFGDVRQTAVAGLIDEVELDVGEDSPYYGSLLDLDLDELDYEDAAAYTYLKDQDVAIPVSEIRIKLLFDLMDNLSVGAGAYAGVWWDAPVPPIVKLGEADLQEDTLVFLGIMGTAELRFFSNAL